MNSFLSVALFNPLSLLTLAFAIMLLLLPYRIAWRGLVLSICTFLTYEYLIPKTMNDHGGWAYALGVSIIFVHVVFLFLIFGLRYFFIRRRRKTPREMPELADHLFFGCLGALSSVFILKYLAETFAGFDDGYIIHVIASLVFLLLSAACFYTRKYLGHAVFALFIGVTAFTGVFSALGTGYGLIVMNSAINKAEGNEYCISLASRQREMRSYQDLTFFTMDKSYGYHAALLVDVQGTVVPYHWSYYFTDFVPGIVNWSNENRPPLYCPAPEEVVQG